MDARFLEILVNKPEMVRNFPEWMLSRSTIHEMRETEGAAIAEIAGRDSVAAVLRACDERAITMILPTVAYTGTEYGRWAVTFEKIDILKERLRKKGVLLFDPVVVGAPKFWWKLCGRNIAGFAKKYGFYSPCVGCHFYFHAIRIPLAKKLNCAIVIGGERESHDGRLKVNQVKTSLDAYVSFMKKFGIELFLPVRHVRSGREVEDILDMPWDEGDEQLECVLSNNYREEDGSVSFDEKAIARYMDEFAVPTAEEMIREVS